MTDDEIRQFIHDIRNPIGALVGFAHLLHAREGKMSKDQRAQVIDSLFKTSERLSSMVDDFAGRHYEST